MLRFTFVLVSFALLFAQFAQSQDRTLIAEGDYAAHRKEGDKVLAHWKFWHLRNGEYEAIESTTRNALITQTFRFDAEFMPIGFALKFDPLPAALNQHPNVPADFQSISISCEYKLQELSCGTEYNGHNSVSSIPAKSPYVFFPGEFYPVDFIWLLTGVVNLVERNAKENTVNVYTIGDNQRKEDEIPLIADIPIKLSFTGTETASIMAKPQQVRKYEVSGSTELSVLTVTSKGLVAVMSGKSDPTSGIGISNYVEYEPWVSPFHPVLRPSLPPEPSSMLPPLASASTPVKRVKVSQGVTQGMVLHKVQPVYPESAKQKGIQGQVSFNAVIGTDGRIIQLTPIYGKEELVAAAMTAVQQWEFRPYVLSGERAEIETRITVNFELSH
jgi:TonB family protein